MNQVLHRFVSSSLDISCYIYLQELEQLSSIVCPQQLLRYRPLVKKYLRPVIHEINKSCTGKGKVAHRIARPEFSPCHYNCTIQNVLPFLPEFFVPKMWTYILVWWPVAELHIWEHATDKPSGNVALRSKFLASVFSLILVSGSKIPG
jgi:hypothetical protein